MISETNRLSLFVRLPRFGVLRPLEGLNLRAAAKADTRKGITRSGIKYKGSMLMGCGDEVRLIGMHCDEMCTFLTTVPPDPLSHHTDGTDCVHKHTQKKPMG